MMRYGQSSCGLAHSSAAAQACVRVNDGRQFLGARCPEHRLARAHQPFHRRPDRQSPSQVIWRPLLLTSQVDRRAMADGLRGGDTFGREICGFR